MNFGEQYALAFSFVALITDTQWDCSVAISTVAKIDISKGQFNYKEHKKNAIFFMWMMVVTSTLMFVSLWWFYDLVLWITLIFLILHFMDYGLWPFIYLHRTFLQLEYSSFITTLMCLVGCFLRFVISLTPTPFCTIFGQITSAIVQLICYATILHYFYHITKEGSILKKDKHIIVNSKK